MHTGCPRTTTTTAVRIFTPFLSWCLVVPLEQQAIARAEGVPFTADAVDPSTNKVEQEAKVEIKITVAPNVTVRRGYVHPKRPTSKEYTSRFRF